MAFPMFHIYSYIYVCIYIYIYIYSYIQYSLTYDIMLISIYKINNYCTVYMYVLYEYVCMLCFLSLVI